MTSYRNLPQLCSRLFFAVFCLFVALSGASGQETFSASIQTALGQAGGNREELIKALKSVPAAQREGMEFLVENMPQRDLESLSAGYLLTNVSLAYDAWQKAPWS